MAAETFPGDATPDQIREVLDDLAGYQESAGEWGPATCVGVAELADWIAAVARYRAEDLKAAAGNPRLPAV